MLSFFYFIFFTAIMLLFSRLHTIVLIVKLRLAFYRKTYVLFHTINNDYFTKYILLVETSSHSYRISYKLQQHDGHIK